MKIKKEIVTMLLAAAMMTSSLTACTEVEAAGNDIDNTTTEAPTVQTTPQNLENIDTTGSNFEETDEKTKESEANAETIDINGEYDPATYMRYTLNDDGNSYSVCPSGLPDVIKELVSPGEYNGLPVTKVYGAMGERSIETIIISEGIQEIRVGFYYCRDIKNIYIPASVSYITECAFNCRATMGGHGFIKSNVIEKIVVAEGNPYYYVDGNCLIDRRSQKIILGCNSSVIPNDGSVKSIGRAAFANCHAIESIIIPKSIVEIEYAAFDNCDNLKQMYLTSSVSTDKTIVNFNEEFMVSYKPEFVLYVPDTEGLEKYSKHFGAHVNIEIGTP